MANKTVLDFPEVTAPEDADVLYAIRGTSTGRDKRITWANLKQFLAPRAHAVTSTIYGVATATLHGHVRLNAAPISGSPDGVSSGGVYTAIAAEESARSTADSNLHQDIADAVGAEATLRGDADNALQEQITANAADIVKLWAPTSYSQQDVGYSGTTLSNTEIVDGACVTVYPTFTGIFHLIIDTPPEGVKVFHVRLKLPTADTDYEQKLSMYYASALDANATIMTRYVQKREAANASYVQYSPVFTFVASGAGWILM